MERLMVVKLAAQGCTAEAWLNGLPVARVTPSAPEAVLPAHEAALAGSNRLELVVGPDSGVADAAALLQTAPHAMAAQVHLLLPRIGRPADETEARTLARLEWTCDAGEPLTLPARRHQDADLAIRFPRWRWLDAPPVPDDPEMRRLILEFVQRLVIDFTRGDPERYLAAARLRFDELAVAYQCTVASLVQRFRDHLQALYAAKASVIVPPTASDLVLHRVADGRLVECLGPTGETLLRTAAGPDGAAHAWPLRLAVVDKRIYVLR